MVDVELIGVPFDGFGRPGNQTGAAAALRAAGLAEAIAPHPVHDTGDLDLPAPDPSRGEGSGMVNEAALLAMTDHLHQRIVDAVPSGRFPLVVGGDCASLLGLVTGLRDAQGRCGLLFVDGHEDTMPLDTSEDGEAANAEIGLLLGLTGRLTTEGLRDRLPALRSDDLALLGPRDVEWRRRFNVASLRDRGTWMRDVTEVAADPGTCGRAAVDHLTATAGRWWLHVDLDVLDPEVFSAQGLPDVEDEPGGLTWEQLTAALVAAVRTAAPLGWSIAIYDPDQDPDRTDAARIVRLVEAVLAEVPGGTGG